VNIRKSWIFQENVCCSSSENLIGLLEKNTPVSVTGLYYNCNSTGPILNFLFRQQNWYIPNSGFPLQTPNMFCPDSKFPSNVKSKFLLWLLLLLLTVIYANTNDYVPFSFRHPRHRKYLIRICDEIHDLRCEKNCPVIILYSLGDNTFKVLM
jgi:hypothetical protein